MLTDFEIDGATREKTSGDMVAWNDEEFPWQFKEVEITTLCNKDYP
jgi:hypothetical protein